MTQKGIAALALAGCVLATALPPSTVVARPDASALSQRKLRRLLRALRDGDRRIRMQALILLARLREQRAVERVARLLAHDRVASVRALAAVCLGATGDKRAIPRLRASLHDRSRAVRRQVRRALAQLTAKPDDTPTSRTARSKARVLVRLGTMGSRVRGRRRLRRAMRHIWQQRLAALPRWAGLARTGDRVRTGQKIFKVNASITSFRRIREGQNVRTSCTVSVMLDHKGSIVMMATGGATVEVAAAHFRRRDAERVDHDALSSAIGSAHRNVLSYLARQ